MMSERIMETIMARTAHLFDSEVSDRIGHLRGDAGLGRSSAIRAITVEAKHRATDEPDEPRLAVVPPSAR